MGMGMRMGMGMKMRTRCFWIAQPFGARAGKPFQAHVLASVVVQQRHHCDAVTDRVQQLFVQRFLWGEDFQLIGPVLPRPAVNRRAVQLLLIFVLDIQWYKIVVQIWKMTPSLQGMVHVSIVHLIQHRHHLAVRQRKQLLVCVHVEPLHIG